MGDKGMQRKFKCRYCNKSFAVADALVTHEKQCLQRKISIDKFKRENPEKARKLGFI